MNEYGFECHCIDFSEFATAEPFDVLSLAGTLPRLPFPRAALGRARSLLADHGLLFLSLPNRDAFAWKALDERNQSPNWRELEHLHHFGRARLYALLRECGFEPCEYGVSEQHVTCMEILARKV
jgi:hypothetical protein